MEILICPSAALCSGCDSWGESQVHQLARKQERVLSMLSEQLRIVPAQISVASLPDRALRDRLDFQIREGVKGLWDKDRRTILDLPECLQLSPALQTWLEDFRRLPFQVTKGSFRLRVSPSGQRGLWLDLSNEDVKSLFEERHLLAELASLAHVEIGQRRKILSINPEGEPKLLKEGSLQKWTRTWVGTLAFDLFSHIGDFSQVGDVANRAIIQALHDVLPIGQELVEFGAGNGNLTFAASEKFPLIRAVEFDASVHQGFEQSLQGFQNLYPQRQITSEQGDFQKRAALFGKADTLLVNPPRSGVGRFFEGIENSKVKNLVYMSCYPESMTKDLAKLGPGWNCEKLILIDQFPQTQHVEVMSLWTRG